MVEVKDAVKISLATFADLFPVESSLGLRLEEIVLEENSQYWNVTVSYKNPDFEDDIASQKSENKSLAAIMGTGASKVPTRHYKTVKVNVLDGSLFGIKNEWHVD